MIRRDPRARAGITLTEILISILIMGVGMISLATLFPLGLSRIRQAARYSRSTLLAETAIDDSNSRNLMSKLSFTESFSFVYGDPAQSYSTTWYPWGAGNGDPLIHDPITPSNPSVSGGVFRTAGPGLIFCYDPLWRTMVGLIPNYPGVPVNEGRFASGIGYLRTDPDGGLPSAHGLQRLTNLPVDLPSSNAPTSSQWGPSSVNLTTNSPFFTRQVIGSIFVAQDDMVFQTENTSGALNTLGGTSASRGSPLVPDLSTGAILGDFTYTWLFTGRQADVTDDSVVEGDVVVFHNRPFAYDNPPAGITRPGTDTGVPAGEQVVEAVFAYGSTTNVGGYCPNDRTVLLRWPSTQPDPEVRVGGFIADVTYERTLANTITRFEPYNASPPSFSANSEYYPGQRCYWYRVVRVTGPEEEFSGATPEPATSGYRRMVVTVSSPVRAKTLVTAATRGVTPIHVNAALVSPYVVNVFSRNFYLR